MLLLIHVKRLILISNHWHLLLVYEDMNPFSFAFRIILFLLWQQYVH